MRATNLSSVFGGEFRDAASVTAYPFTDDSTFLGDKGLVIPIGWVLDAIIHPYGAFTLPIRIGAITFTAGVGVSVHLLDASDKDAGTALLDAVYETLTFKMDNRVSGTMVVNPELSRTLIEAIKGQAETFSQGAMNLLASRCYPINTTTLLPSIVLPGDSVDGDVTITGIEGLKITDKGGYAELSLDPTSAVLPRYLKKMNGAADRNIFILTPPSCGLRISASEGQLELTGLN